MDYYFRAEKMNVGYDKKRVRKDRQIYGKSNYGTRDNV